MGFIVLLGEVEVIAIVIVVVALLFRVRVGMNVVTVIAVLVTVGELMLVRTDVLSLGSAEDDPLDEVGSAVAVAAVIVMLAMMLRLCGVGSLAVDVIYPVVVNIAAGVAAIDGCGVAWCW